MSASDGKTAKFTFSHVSTLLQTPDPLQWLIEDYLLPNSLAMLFGEPAAGKSLLALRWSVELAMDNQPVFIIAGEGHFGIRRRLKAIAKHDGCEKLLQRAPLVVSDHGAAFLNDEGFMSLVEGLNAMQKAHGEPALIVVDTVHRNFGPGEENSAKDVSLFIERADYLRDAYGASVMLVHHSGHSNTGRARGSSSLRGAVDTELCLTYEDDARVLEVTKMKDAPTPEPRAFEIHQLELGWFFDNGEPETSVVLNPSDRPVANKGAKGKQLTKTQRQGLETLKTALEATGEPPPWDTATDTDPPSRVVHLDHWREHFYITEPDRSQEATKKAFQRVRNVLQTSKRIGERDNYFWLEDAIKVLLQTKADMFKRPIGAKKH